MVVVDVGEGRVVGMLVRIVVLFIFGLLRDSGQLFGWASRTGRVSYSFCVATKNILVHLLLALHLLLVVVLIRVSADCKLLSCGSRSNWKRRELVVGLIRRRRWRHGVEEVVVFIHGLGDCGELATQPLEGSSGKQGGMEEWRNREVKKVCSLGGSRLKTGSQAWVLLIDLIFNDAWTVHQNSDGCVVQPKDLMQCEATSGRFDLGLHLWDGDFWDGERELPGMFWQY